MRAAAGKSAVLLVEAECGRRRGRLAQIGGRTTLRSLDLSQIAQICNKSEVSIYLPIWAKLAET